MLTVTTKKCVAGLLICALLMGIATAYNITPTEATDTHNNNRSSNSKMIALTFDDGPSDYTNQLLDILSDNDAKATFFVQGQNIGQHLEVLTRASLLGCEILGHSWDHSDYAYLTYDEIRQDLQRTNDAIFDTINVYPDMFRPPYGVFDDPIISVAEDMGLAIILWTVDSRDWDSRSVDAIYQTIMANARNGVIVLCHDKHEETIVAMEQVIPDLISNGYELVTVSELLGKTEPGKLYANTIFDWKGLTHTVLPNDNLWTIAQLYGTTISAIKTLNELETDIVLCGTILRIPCTGAGFLHHEWGEGVHTDPTCVTNEYWVFKCDNCPVSYTEENKGTAFGHTKVIEYVEATSTEDGYVKEFCSICGDIFSYKVIEATGYLVSISVTTMPDKMVYTQGDFFDLTGMIVTATYNKGEPRNVDKYTTSLLHGSLLSDVGTFTVEISYTENAITKTSSFIITVLSNENTPIVHVTSVAGRAGDEVTLTVLLKNNPGIASYSITMCYPDTLTYVSASMGDILASNFYTMPTLEQVTVIAASPMGTDISTGNILFTLTFKIKEGTPVGVIDGLCLGYFNEGLDGIKHNEKLEHYLIDQGIITIIPSELSGDVSLRDLSVSVGTLVPVFNSATTSYSMIVPNNVDSVTIFAVANDAMATVSGDMGQQFLVIGVNSFSIVVTAENGAKETYTLTITRDNAHLHSYVGEIITVATCTENGKMMYTCSCGDSYTATIAMYGHDFSILIDNKGATCETAGYNLFKCIRCDETDIVNLPILEHILVKMGVVVPTCVDRGYTIYTCSICESSYFGDFVNAHGHTLSSPPEVVPPVGEVNGYVRVFCSTCDYEEITILQASGHDLHTTIIVATCEVDGYVRVFCSTCDYEEIAVLRAFGHVWSAGVVTVEPTEVYEGVLTVTCNICGNSRTEVIPCLAHKHVYTFMVTGPTCVEQGYTTYSCDCGDNYVENFVDALDHLWNEGVVTVFAARDSDGAILFTCLRCTEVKTEFLIYYVVQSGDTLGLIAQTYGGTSDMLKALNKLTSDVLQPGMVLQVISQKGGGSSGGGSSTWSNGPSLNGFQPNNSTPNNPEHDEPQNIEFVQNNPKANNDNENSSVWSLWRIILVVCVVVIISAMLTIIGVADNLLPKRSTHKA